MSKSLSSNVSQHYYNGFIPFCVYPTYFTLPINRPLQWILGEILIKNASLIKWSIFDYVEDTVLSIFGLIEMISGYFSLVFGSRTALNQYFWR